NGLAKAGSEQFLLDQGREPKVEVIFPEAARAGGTRGLGGVSDVHDNAKGGMVAGRKWRLLRRTTGAFGPRALPCARPRHERSNDGRDQSDRAKKSHSNLPQAPGRQCVPNRTSAGRESSLQ